MTAQLIASKPDRRWNSWSAVAVLTVVWLVATPVVSYVARPIHLDRAAFGNSEAYLAAIDAVHRAWPAFAASAVFGPLLIACVAAKTGLRTVAVVYGVLAGVGAIVAVFLFDAIPTPNG